MSHQPQSQNTRRRGPKLSIPLDADVASVRYYRCPPKELLAVKERPALPPPATKVHLKFIPRCLRRPTQWTPLLNEWLTACEAKKTATATMMTSSSTEEEEDSSCNSSTSGHFSGGTATTDFSSISSPRKTAAEHSVDHHALPLQQQQHLQYHHLHQQQLQAPESRIDHHHVQQQYYQHPSPPPAPLHYPFRVPVATSASTQLTPAQWAELAHLQRASMRPTAAHPPPKLMSVHTAYLPELDAAVRAMMAPQPHSRSVLGPAPSISQQHANNRSVPVPGLPWQQYVSYYGTNQGPPLKGAPLSSSTPASSTISTSAHGSTDSKDRSQVCSFCYQHEVHEAHNKAARLPRIAEKGCWRGHVMQEGATIVCPRLLRRVCSLCGATGQSAHQTNYCPTTKKQTSCY